MKRWFKSAALLALGAGASSLAYASQVERKRLDITHLPILVYALAPAFDGYRIVQFSDLHMDGRSTTRARVEAVVAAVNAQQPDLIAFTGDFVTERINFRLDDLIAPLSQLRAPDGVLAVMGNHDHRLNAGLIQRVMRDSGMINLNNAVRSVRRGADCLHFAGVDSLVRQRARIDLVLEQLPADAPVVLLAHEPDFADVAAPTKRFALQLSGHSHGGQIRLPLFTRLMLPPYGRRYDLGPKQVEEMTVYTNRGIGTVGLPLRFNCPPEITVFTLKSPK